MEIRAERVREQTRATQRRYRATFRFQEAGRLLFEADIIGSAMSDRIDGRTPDGALAWHTRRNRAILPTLWQLRDGDDREIGALRKGLVRRNSWRAELPVGGEAFSLGDPRGAFERTFDLPPSAGKPEFNVVRDGRAIGVLTRVPSGRPEEAGRGPLKVLARLFRTRDWLLTIGDAESAPDPRLAALAIILAHEVTLRYRGID